MGGFITFLTLNGVISLTVIYLLQRYMFGEHLRDLNLKQGKWWQDVLTIIVIVIITLGVLPFLTDPLTILLPPQDTSDLENLVIGLAENLWYAVLFIGPVLFLSVGFEEVTRVFFLNRAWKAWSSMVDQWINVVISALVFAFAHWYQGPAGILTAGIYGLVMAIYYRFFGRLFPMVVAHYLHNAIQFVFVIIMIRNGTIQY